jgi:aspartate dehydrogenase
VPPLRVGYIGDGAIARKVREELDRLAPGRACTAAVLRRTGSDDAPAALEEFLAASPDIVVEVASQEAVRLTGERILAAGVPLVIVSVGALADADLHARLTAAAEAAGSKIIVATGALAGIDALLAAKAAGLTAVRYRGTKPPAAWKGTPAERVVDLDAIGADTVFFRGTAREAVELYPRNANVAATIALAGLGFDDTQVELVAAPGADRNRHELSFDGAAASATMSITAAALPDNPKSSALAAYSVLKVLLGFCSPLTM